MEQISYLLFMRRLDEIDRKRAEDAEWTGVKYTSLFAGTHKAPDGTRRRKKELRWSSFRHELPEEALVRDRVFPFIKGLGGQDQPFAKYMDQAVFIVPKMLVEPCELQAVLSMAHCILANRRVIAALRSRRTLDPQDFTIFYNSFTSISPPIGSTSE